MKYEIKKINGFYCVVSQSGIIWFKSARRINCKEWMQNCLMPEKDLQTA